MLKPRIVVTTVRFPTKVLTYVVVELLLVVALEVVQLTDMKMVVVSWGVIGPIGLLPEVATPTMASTISAAATRLAIIAVELTPLRVLTLLNTRRSIDNLIGSCCGCYDRLKMEAIGPLSRRS